jgi:hypothetical protein
MLTEMGICSIADIPHKYVAVLYNLHISDANPNSPYNLILSFINEILKLNKCSQITKL